MITDLVQIKRLGSLKLEENKRLRVHMKSHAVADRRLRKVGEEVENAIDCTACANCCRTATARLRDREVDTLSKYIGTSRREFLQNYCEDTGDEGLILKRVEGQGCIFLENNLCSVYEVRPMTCEDFPHLVRGPGSLVSRMWVMPERATYCPIAYNTLEAFKVETGFSSNK